MNIKTGKVMAGFLRLSPSERNEFIEEVNKYLRAEVDERELITEGIEKLAGVVLGPTTSGVCPCCGK